jgi:hypothetical protein
MKALTTGDRHTDPFTLDIACGVVVGVRRRHISPDAAAVGRASSSSRRVATPTDRYIH